MSRGTVSASIPALTRADAWLLAAFTEGSSPGRPVRLRDLVHDADWLNRAIPTFDEMSFGLRRLVAAGFLVIQTDRKGGLRFEATPTATSLRRSLRPNRLGVIEAMGEAVGATPYPSPEPAEDRSLGPLAGLDAASLEKAIRQHGEWVERWSKPFMVAARALVWWQNRKR